MKQVLILGRHGQLGRALVETLSEKEKDILCLEDNPDLSPFTTHLDILDYDFLEDLIKARKVDCIINCAAMTDVDACERNPQKAMLVNGSAVAALAELTIRYKIPLIHISTNFVFDGKEPSLLSETAPICVPCNSYGYSKYIAEHAIEMAYSEPSARALPYAIIRTSWLHSPYLGKSLDNLIKNWQNPGDVIAYPAALDVISSPTSVFSLANFIWKLANALAERKLGSGTWHYTDAGACSQFDYWTAIHRDAEVLGLLDGFAACIMTSDARAVYKNKARRPSITIMDTSRALAMTHIPHWRRALSDNIRRLKELRDQQQQKLQSGDGKYRAQFQ